MIDIISLIKFGKPSKLRGYEEALLKSFIASSGENESRLFKKQIELINLVQRFQNDLEVNLYSVKLGKILKPGNLSVTRYKGECCLGYFKIDYINHSMSDYAEIWAVDGWIFSLEFTSVEMLINNVNFEINLIKTDGASRIKQVR
jgi:hypothetical protein